MFYQRSFTWPTTWQATKSLKEFFFYFTQLWRIRKIATGFLSQETETAAIYFLRGTFEITCFDTETELYKSNGIDMYASALEFKRASKERVWRTWNGIANDLFESLVILLFEDCSVFWAARRFETKIETKVKTKKRRRKWGYALDKVNRRTINPHLIYTLEWLLWK